RTPSCPRSLPRDVSRHERRISGDGVYPPPRRLVPLPRFVVAGARRPPRFRWVTQQGSGSRLADQHRHRSPLCSPSCHATVGSVTPSETWFRGPSVQRTTISDPNLRAEMTTTAASFEAEPPTSPNTPRSDTLRSRFLPASPTPLWWGWLSACAVALFAGALRFFHLGVPSRIHFDETYYAKDAYGLWFFGYEHETVENADDLLSQGHREIFTGAGDFVVHPPVGKWMIALGDALWSYLPFGTAMTPEGWRFAAALAGIFSVLILVRLATRMTRSLLLGCTAGLILALDGLHFTLSRIAMVDIFLTLWILAGFTCLVIDRDKTRERMVRLSESGVDPTTIGWLGMRWWRLAAGVCFGLAIGTKWSALFFVAAFGLLTVAWDYGMRRSAGQRNPFARWLGI